jgi:hypothetical protein
MKLALTIILGLVLAGSSSAATGGSTLTIRHQLHGCHSWSFDGTSWRASQSVAVKRGSVLTVVDNDVMPHTLIQTHGPKALVTGAAMKHMGARAHVAFAAKGTYVFTTKVGEDYMKGVKTIGEDNVLRLVVKVA